MIYPRLLIAFGILVFFTNLILMEFQVRCLALFLLSSVIDGFEWFWGSSQEYPVNAGVPQSSILDPTLFLLYIYDLPNDVICNITIYVDDTTLYSKYDKGSYLWKQLELASELESDLQHTVGWDRKWLVLEKLSLFHLAGLTTLVLLMWKWMDLFMRKNNLLRCWRWLSLLNWIGALTSSPLQKLLPRKLELWFVLWSFSLLMLLCISVNWPYSWSSSCYLEVDELQKRICRTAGPYLMQLLNTWLTIKM